MPTRPLRYITPLILSFGFALNAAEPARDVRAEIRGLRLEIARHDELYHRQGKTEISDADYDALRVRLAQWEDEHPAAALAAGAELPPVPDDRSGVRPEHAHHAPMLSLTKVRTPAEVRAFHERLARRFGAVVPDDAAGLAPAAGDRVGASFAGLVAGNATKVAYVVDASGSMIGRFPAIVDEVEAGADATDLDSLAGLGHTRPWLATGLSVCLLSLAGFPATIGFVGKFMLFSAAVEAGYVGLAVIGAIGAAILGVLADHWGIVAVYQICAVLPLLGLAAFLLPDTRH